MNDVKSFGIFALCVVPFYLWSVYDSFFETRIGYIYDLSSDQLYRIELSPSIYPSEQWTSHLNPFSSPHFGEISTVERQGSLTEKIAEWNKPVDSETFEAELERLWEDHDIESLYAEYWPRWDLDPKSLLPPQWRRLPETLGDFDGEIIPADVVIARYLWSRERWSAEPPRPSDLQMLRGVLVLKESAARAVNGYCFWLPQYQWPECAQNADDSSD